MLNQISHIAKLHHFLHFWSLFCIYVNMSIHKGGLLLQILLTYKCFLFVFTAFRKNQQWFWRLRLWCYQESAPLSCKWDAGGGFLCYKKNLSVPRTRLLFKWKHSNTIITNNENSTWVKAQAAERKTDSNSNPNFTHWWAQTHYLPHLGLSCLSCKMRAKEKRFSTVHLINVYYTF